MYKSLFLSYGLILCGILLSFFKDLYSNKKDKKSRLRVVFTFIALVLGISGAAMAFYSAKNEIDEKVAIASAKPNLNLKR